MSLMRWTGGGLRSPDQGGHVCARPLRSARPGPAAENKPSKPLRRIHLTGRTG